MISSASCRVFILSNTLLPCVAYVMCWMHQWIGSSWILLYLLHLAKNHAFIYACNAISSHKPRIKEVTENNQDNQDNLCIESYPGEFHWFVQQSTWIEVMAYTTLFPWSSFDYGIGIRMVATDMLVFVPLSFCFEVIFDLFHYLAHRLVHHPLLYPYVHKRHHTYPHPIAILAFYHDPLDLVLTNVIPVYVTMQVLLSVGLSMTYFQFMLIMVYKLYGEVCGHVGKQCNPSSSFTQLVWLPRWLGIELKVEDHDKHHSLTHCNYSKRFKLWDRVFDTYQGSYQDKDVPLLIEADHQKQDQSKDE